mgnify:FL=1
MSDELYQQKIISHARDDSHRGRLEDADATATVDNPVCGDRVTIDLEISNGTISRISHHTRGCLLCNASAALLSKHAREQTATDVTAATLALKAILKGNHNAPGEPWQDLAVFKPVADHKSRHACVLLPFQAVAEALGDN